MRISTKGRYALRLMLDLAEHQGDGCVSLKDVAQRQDISKKYLEQIVPTLSRAGFLLTNRGYQGGYRLARRPEDYTARDILRLTEGSLAPVTCLDCEVNTCPRSANCPTLPLWQGLDRVIEDYLAGVTLLFVSDRPRAHRGVDSLNSKMLAAALGRRLLYSQAVTGAWWGAKFGSLHPVPCRSVRVQNPHNTRFVKFFSFVSCPLVPSFSLQKL